MGDCSLDSTPPLIISPHFHVRRTPWSGLGVYTSDVLPRHTPLHTCEHPAAHVVLREYKREACAWCFAYQGGRHWKVSDAGGAVWFCTAECRAGWAAWVGEEGKECWTRVEAWAKGVGKEEEVGGRVEGNGHVPPEEQEVDKAWAAADEVAERIRQARALDSGPSKQTKAQRRVLSFIRSKSLPHRCPDTVAFLLSGLLTSTRHPTLFASLNRLTASQQPHTYSYPSELHQHTTSYLVLLSLLPAALLPSLTPALCRSLAARDTHNSFGIWSPDESDDSRGAEMLGFGMWPSASFFNHSCAPNVAKDRVRRSHVFKTAREVREGEELCISYLGGEERTLSRKERREKLAFGWGFECACPRCTAEADEDRKQDGPDVDASHRSDSR